MVSEKNSTPVGLKVLGVWLVCGHSGETLQGSVPQSECYPAFLSTAHFLVSGISYLKRVPRVKPLQSLQSMVEGERNTIRDFQVVIGADLGPTGNLHLTQTHAIWV